MSVVDRIERSPFWLIGRILIPAKVRARACAARGEHRLQLADLGRTKVCFSCGTGVAV